MKTHLALMLANLMLGKTAMAAESAFPTFPEMKMEAPSLSLRTALKQPLLALTPPGPAGFFARAATILPASRPLFAMPVLMPNAGVDYKLLIKHPDESADYKLRIIGSSPK